MAETEKIYKLIDGVYVEVQPVNKPVQNLYDTLSTPISTTGSLNILGKSLAFDSDLSDANNARETNALRIAGSAGLSLLNITKDLAAGYGFEKKSARATDDYYKQQTADVEYVPVRALGGEGRPVEGNVVANVEGGEVIQTEDGKVTNVEGAKHSQGGVNVKSEQEFDVVSDRITIGEIYKDLNKTFVGLKLKSNDTMAVAVRKFQGFLNLEGELKKVEGILKKMGDQKKTKDIPTKRVNNEFLKGKLDKVKVDINKKVYDLEQFTKLVYQLQEEVKGTAQPQQPQPQQPQPQQPQPQQFALGGSAKARTKYADTPNDTDPPLTQGVLNTLAYIGAASGMSTDEQKEMLDKVKDLDFSKAKEILSDSYPKVFAKMQNSSIKDLNVADGIAASELLRGLKLSTAGKLQVVRNTFALDNYKNQHLTNEGVPPPTSGKVDDNSLTKRLTEEVKFFPDLKKFLTLDNNNNVVGFKEGVDIKGFQNYIQKQYDDYEILGVGDNNFINAINNLEWDDTTAKAFDGIYGDFTSSRSGVSVNVVLPETLKTLKDKGITNINQITDDILRGLTATEQKNIEDFRKLQIQKKTQVNPLLAEYVVNAAERKDLEKLPIKRTEIPIDDVEIKVKDRPTAPPVQQDNYSGNLYVDRLLLPPDSLTVHTKVDNSLGRVDPIRITDEQVRRKASESEQFTARELAKLPDSARRAVLSNSIANSQAATNNSLVQIDKINVANQENADRVNMGQRDREVKLNNAEALRYEKIQLIAQDKTSQDLSNYFLQLEDNRLNSQAFRNNTSLINAIRENYNVDPVTGELISITTGDIVTLPTTLEPEDGVLPNASAKKKKKKKATTTTKTKNKK